MHLVLDAKNVPHALECAEEGEIHKSLQFAEFQDVVRHKMVLLSSKDTW